MPPRSVRRRNTGIESVRRGPSLKPIAYTPSRDPTHLSVNIAEHAGAAPVTFLSSTWRKGAFGTKRMFRAIQPSTQNSKEICLAADIPSNRGAGLSRTETIAPSPRHELQVEDRLLMENAIEEQPLQGLAESRDHAPHVRKRVRQVSSLPASLEAKVKPQPAQPTPNIDVPKPHFACPFYKFHPEQYRDCRRFEMTRVKDVKQHIHRKHGARRSCSQCLEVFTTLECLEHHRQDGERCRGLNPLLRGGISAEQQSARMDAKGHSRGKPPEEQWRDVWRLLFPGRPAPLSVYLENDTEEFLSRLQSYWLRKRVEITNGIIQKTVPGTLLFTAGNPNQAVYLFDDVVESFLSQFQAETTRSPDTRNSLTLSNSWAPDSIAWKEEEGRTMMPITADPYCPPDIDPTSRYDSVSGFRLAPESPWPFQHHCAPTAGANFSSSRTDSLPHDPLDHELEMDSTMGSFRNDHDWVDRLSDLQSEFYHPTGLPVYGDAIGLHRHTWSGSLSTPQFPSNMDIFL